MIRRSTWIFLAVFLILLAGMLFWQKSSLNNPAETPTPSPTSLPPIFAGLDDISITRIEIKNGQNITILIRDQSKQWNFPSDVSTTADQGRVEELITTLKSLKPLSKIDPAPPLSAMGLEESDFQIVLSTSDGVSPMITIGQQTVTGSGYYARINQKYIVVLNKISIEELLKLLTIENLSGSEISTPTS